MHLSAGGRQGGPPVKVNQDREQRSLPQTLLHGPVQRSSAVQDPPAGFPGVQSPCPMGTEKACVFPGSIKPAYKSASFMEEIRTHMGMCVGS